MARKRHTPRERLLVTGTMLLLLLLTGVFLTGRAIGGMATQMHDRIVAQIGDYHYRMLRFEFDKTAQTLSIAGTFLQQYPSCPQERLEVLAATLLAQDPKLGRLWLLDSDATTVYDCPRGALPHPTRPDTNRLRREMVAAMHEDGTQSRIATVDGNPTWCAICRITDRDGIVRICGADFPLKGIHAYMSEQNPFSRSYATLYTADGRIVYHPDGERIGRLTADTLAREAVRRVLATGRQVILHGVVSDYLRIGEERIYYPLDVEGTRWVAAIGIPQLAIGQQMSRFHLFTVLAAILSVLFFAVLLIAAQRRWQREYDLRIRSERESEQLQLQQVLEQIDPHFLFNSLNTLYSLIRSNPAQAREFTLTLSRVYRHVLEHRREILATVSDEIDFSWQYHSLLKIRFGGCIHLTTTVDPALLRHRIPAFSLQTLVENAVKHNHITAENPLRIRIFTEGDALTIENNHTPRRDEDSSSTGTGLERIRAVYRFYTAENIGITTSEGLFRCRLPLLPPAE